MLKYTVSVLLSFFFLTLSHAHYGAGGIGYYHGSAPGYNPGYHYNPHPGGVYYSHPDGAYYNSWAVPHVNYLVPVVGYGTSCSTVQLCNVNGACFNEQVCN